MEKELAPLSVMENKVLEGLVSSNNKQVAFDLGIPVKAVAALLQRNGVKEYLAELKSAQREMLLSKSISVLAATLDDKLEMIEEDGDVRLGSATRKDHVEIAIRLAELLKSNTPQEELINDPMAKIYQQINIINKGESQ